jgi:hypothetical protein
VTVEVLVPLAVMEAGLALMIEFAALADPAVTVSCCVPLVKPLLAVVIVGVPALVSVYVNVAVLEPLAMESGLTGLNVTVPVDELVRPTLVVPVVTGLPY